MGECDGYLPDKLLQSDRTWDTVCTFILVLPREHTSGLPCRFDRQS